MDEEPQRQAVPQLDHGALWPQALRFCCSGGEHWSEVRGIACQSPLIGGSWPGMMGILLRLYLLCLLGMGPGAGWLRT